MNPIFKALVTIVFILIEKRLVPNAKEMKRKFSIKKSIHTSKQFKFNIFKKS